jgi:hypothetical protein
MVGVPWLAYFVARSAVLIGHLSVYSWDDWLAYQVAGARIYMHGYWLEGGSRTFDYQALYRWISGALHMAFGDSSVGETYLDAACLLVGSLLAFSLVRPAGGFRAALLACAGTLATFTLGTPWYFVGRQPGVRGRVLPHARPARPADGRCDCRRTCCPHVLRATESSLVRDLDDRAAASAEDSNATRGDRAGGRENSTRVRSDLWIRVRGRRRALRSPDLVVHRRVQRVVRNQPEEQ